MYFTVILKASLHKEDIQKEWLKFGQNAIDLIQAKDLLTKLEWYLKKGFLTLRYNK